jgi:hypothetical protein
MKRALYTLAAAVIMMTLNACGGAPEVSYYQIGPGDKVGVFVSVGDTLFHSASGEPKGDLEGPRSTVKRYTAEWGIRRYIKSRLVADLQGRRGLKVVDLRRQGVTYNQLAGLIARRGGEWAVRPNRQGIYDRLMRELKLKAVILVTERRTYATSFCVKDGCVDYYLGGHGLISIGDAVFRKYFSVAAYETDIFILDPMANLGLGGTFKRLDKKRVRRLRGFTEPRDLKKLTNKDWGRVLIPIKGYVDELVGVIGDTLRAQ